MHANRNKSAVKRVEKGMMKANRTRNLFAVFAIVLTTFMITTVIFFAAAILTQFMSNIPTILLFLPIGLSIAESIGVSPYPVAMVVTLAGAASYATPFAAPQNMMTVGWTRYKFVDFVKIGIPMLIITWLVVGALIPVFLPY